MATAPLVPRNRTIASVKPLRRRPRWQWPTVLPFVPLYLMALAALADPRAVWGRQRYALYMSYIDFGHSMLLPLLGFVHAFASLLTMWSVAVRVRWLFRPATSVEDATHVFIDTHPHQGDKAVLEVVKEEKRTSAGATVRVVSFCFQQRRWTFDVATGMFQKTVYPTRQTMSYYRRCRGLTQEEQRVSRDTYGENRVAIDVPEFTTLLVDHAFAPFFVFQMFCVLLWCLDEYWMYSLFTGFMMCFMECIVVMSRIRNMTSLRAMATLPTTHVTVVRRGTKEIVRSTELLPLDVVLVPSNAPCPADAVLISGSCVVNEAMLTGESTPVLKEEPDSMQLEHILKSKVHMKNVIFAGTQIMLSQGSNFCIHTNSHAATAVVIKTGFATRQGKLLRTILHSQSRVSENSSEAFAFIGVLLCVALVAVAYLLKHGLADPNKSRWKLALHSVQIITSVVPAELPIELSLAVNTSLLALGRLRVFCTEPFRIPFSGKLDTCCFDKTGTLTTDEMLFAGVDMADGLGLRVSKEEIPREAVMVLASCQSLVRLDQRVVAGDGMEKAAFLTLGCDLSSNDSVEHADVGPLKIFKRFAFNSDVKRMAVVASIGHRKHGEFIVAAKGAPESILSICGEVPISYKKTFEAHANEGRRVIALARRVLPPAQSNMGDAEAITRDGAERGLTFCGFAIFSCPLKADAQETIEALRGGSQKCVMVTGDHFRTSAAVARSVAICTAPRATVISAAEEGPGYAWQGPAPSEVAIYDNAAGRNAKDNEVDLVVNVEGMSDGAFAEVLRKWGDRVCVWSRCSPTHKEAIIMNLKDRGRFVLMAGDGTNDVGGLKQAHVGIAVLNASCVAPAAPTNSQPGAVEPAKEKLVPGCIPEPQAPPPLPKNPGFMDTMRHQMAAAKLEAVKKHNARVRERYEKEKASRPAPPPEAPSAMTSAFNAMDELDGTVKLGDASIAAPFTAKSKRLMAVVDTVRLGRNTLVTTMQMYKILALNCLVSAYSMSVLHTDGVKLGDTQMVVSGMILSVCFLFLSKCNPSDRLARERPVMRVFHPYMLCTIALQFALHLTTIVNLVQAVADVDAEGVAAQRSSVESTDFKPSLLNSVVFLSTTLMTAVTFVVNYRGEPFMKSLRHNKPMVVGVAVLVVLLFTIASETDPELNKTLQVVPFPSEEFRNVVLWWMAVDSIGAFVIEGLALKLLSGL